MRLEPKECRLQALTCDADLAKNWLKVADEIQAANPAKPFAYRQKEEAPYSARTGASKNGGSAA